MNDEIKKLLNRYQLGDATQQDLAKIEQLLENGSIQLEDLEDLSTLENQLSKIETPEPSLNLDDRFYATLAIEKKKTKKFSFDNWFGLSPVGQKFALAAFTFLIGIAAGYLLIPTSSKSSELQSVKQEVSDLKEMMMLSLLEKESATERLRAVSISQEMDKSSDKVINALVKTLNNDENINVRLAALEALTVYGNDSKVRTHLIESIAQQESPLVQIALAEVMVSLQEKSSVKEFEKLLKSENTPPEVKNKIRERIDVLI